MISTLFRPLLPWLVRQLLAMVLRALGRDLRQRLPEVFELIDAEILQTLQLGARHVTMAFFVAVQRVVHRDPTSLEVQILKLIFDPAIAASRLQSTTSGQ